MPRHDLSQGDHRENWEVVRGRTHSNQQNPNPPCHHGAVQARLSSLRIPGQLGCECCPALELCRANRSQNPEEPFYHAQFEKKAPITVHPVQHFLMPSVLRPAKIVALDDCDLRTFCIEDVKLSRAALEYALHWAIRHPAHPYAFAQPFLELLVRLTREIPVGEFLCQGAKLFSVLENLAQPHVQIDLADILAMAKLAQEPDPFGDQNLLLARLDVPVRFIVELQQILSWEWERYQTRGEREWESWNCRTRIARKGSGGEVEFNLKLRRNLPLDTLKDKDIVLVDASLSPEETLQLFPGRQLTVIDPYVEMPVTVEIFQYPDQAWGKLRLQDQRARGQALAEIAAVIEKHAYESIGLITHKSLALEAQHRFPRLKVGHFFGQRGSNQFKDCDVLIVFGTPNPNPVELQQLAETLLLGCRHRLAPGQPGKALL